MQYIYQDIGSNFNTNNVQFIYHWNSGHLSLRVGHTVILGMKEATQEYQVA